MKDKNNLIEIVNNTFDGYEQTIEDYLGQGGDYHLHYKIGQVIGMIQESLRQEIIDYFKEGRT